MANGDTMVECAQCEKVGVNRVDLSDGRRSRVGGFVCLGGRLTTSGRIRALCAECVTKANAAFARAAAFGGRPKGGIA
jgi:hypothetical protein